MSRCAYCFHDPGPGRAGAECPNCEKRFPNGWHDAHATCIALAGGRWTGKSIYIGVLVAQLREFVRQQHGVLRFGSPESARLYAEHYERPLFEERGMLRSTPTMKTGSYQREPLVLRIESPGRPRHHLVIRDTAGEDLETPSPEVDLGYLGSADAVIFLFDPCHVREVQEKLRLPPVQARQPHDVLDNVLELMHSGRPRIAVALSKFDVLQRLAEKEVPGWQEIMTTPGAAFQREPEFGRPYDEVDGALLHEEVRSLLLRFGAHEITNRIAVIEQAKPDWVRYFAVSALGAMPRGLHVNPQGIAPFRCMDPVRWACAGSGVLEPTAVPH
jgi:hypothetical protein